jgi:hypothetical protein
MDLNLILQVLFLLAVVVLAIGTGVAIYFALSWLLEKGWLRRLGRAIGSTIGRLLKASVYGIGLALVGVLTGIMTGVPAIAAILAAVFGVIGFAHGLTGQPLNFGTGTRPTGGLGSGYARQDYRRMGFSDDDIRGFGLDQPGAPPPGIAPFVLDDLMRRDDPWDADFWGGEDIDPFDGPDLDAFDIDPW